MFAFFQPFDSAVLLWIQTNLRCDTLSAFLIPLTIFGGCGTMWILISTAMLFSQKTRKTGWLALLSLLLCYLFNDELLKVLINRPRPFLILDNLTTLVKEPTSYSFPSGHACAAFAAATTYCRGLFSTPAKTVLLLFAFAMAFSRLYVGVHNPTDVLAGMVVGWLGSAVIWRLFQHRYDQIESKLTRKA